MEDLIFGKNKLQRIVSVEPIDGALEVYYEDEDGIPYYDIIDNKYWLLTNFKPRPNTEKLDGNLYYKYITKVDTISEFKELKKRNYATTFTINDLKEASMVYKGMSYFKGMKVEDVSVLSFDIETVGLEHNEDSKVLLISNTFRNKHRKIKKLFAYTDYNNDKEFFDAWCNWVRDLDPSIIIGHNINVYDFPYMSFCANKAGTKINLGRNSSEIEFSDYESKFRKDGSQSYPYHKIKIHGREIIDTFFLSIKYDISRKYQSYGLKRIIEQEGLEKKNRQFYDASTIKDNYTIPEEWEKIKAYAMDDADDALALYDLMIPAFFYMTQSVPRSFQSMIESASGGQINSIMLRSYLQIGHSIPKTSEMAPFEGAISFGVPGIYKNVMKIDFSGLYPSIMREYKVYDNKKDPKGHFLKLVDYFAEFRLKYKKLYKETNEKHYDDLQGSLKIFANSTYGFLGAPGLCFNSPHNAAFITQKGRELLKYTIEWATSKPYEYWKNKVNPEEEVENVET
jgi:DNA polymerase I